MRSFTRIAAIAGLIAGLVSPSAGDMGFELEAGAGWCSPVQPLVGGVAHQIPKGTELLKWFSSGGKPLFALTADTTGVGANSYEFVTSPFGDIDKNNRNRFCDTVRKLFAAADSISNTCNAPHTGTLVHAPIVGGNDVTTNTPVTQVDVKCGGTGGWTPQATMSMTVANAWHLFTKLAAAIVANGDYGAIGNGPVSSYTAVFLSHFVRGVEHAVGNAGPPELKAFLLFLCQYAMKPPSDSYTAQKSRACDVKYRKVIGNHMLLRTNLAEIWHGVVKDALPPALKTLSDTALVARLTGYIDAAYTRADHLGTTDGFLKNGKHYETCKNDAGETIFWKTIGDEDTPSITLKTLLDKVIKEGIDALSDNPFSVIEITDAGVKNYLPVGSRAKFASVQKDAKKLILDLGGPDYDRDTLDGALAAKLDAFETKWGHPPAEYLDHEGLGMYPLVILTNGNGVKGENLEANRKGIMFEWRQLGKGALHNGASDNVALRTNGPESMIFYYRLSKYGRRMSAGDISFAKVTLRQYC